MGPRSVASANLKRLTAGAVEGGSRWTLRVSTQAAYFSPLSSEHQFFIICSVLFDISHNCSSRSKIKLLTGICRIV